MKMKNFVFLVFISCILIISCDKTQSDDSNNRPPGMIKILTASPILKATVSADTVFHVMIAYTFNRNFGKDFYVKAQFLHLDYAESYFGGVWHTAPSSDYTDEDNIIEFDYRFPSGLDLTYYFKGYFSVRFEGYYTNKNGQKKSINFDNLCESCTLIYYKP